VLEIFPVAPPNWCDGLRTRSEGPFEHGIDPRRILRNGDRDPIGALRIRELHAGTLAKRPGTQSLRQVSLRSGPERGCVMRGGLAPRLCRMAGRARPRAGELRPSGDGGQRDQQGKGEHFV